MTETLSGNGVFFSVIAPAYKDKYLEESIESVLGQTYRDFEIILIDDGSKDKTSEICDRYAASNDMIRVFHRENSGVLDSRCFGLSQARGNWVVFIDDDDRMKPYELQVLSEKIQQYSNADCIIFGFEHLLNADGNWKTAMVSDSSLPELLYTENKSIVCTTVFAGSTYISVWRKAVRRSCVGLDSVPDSFREFRNFGDDTFQTVEILRHCKNFLFIPDVLYEWRRHDAGLTGAVKFPCNKVRFFKEKYVVEFLNEEKVFSDKDFDQYRSFLRQSLFVSLVEVATSSRSLNQKKEWYGQYRESDGFYDSFLSSSCGPFNFPTYKSRALKLLEKRRYISLLLYCIVCKICSIISGKPLDRIN